MSASLYHRTWAALASALLLAWLFAAKGDARMAEEEMQAESGNYPISIWNRIELKFQEDYYLAHEQELLREYPGQYFVVSGFHVYKGEILYKTMKLATDANPDGLLLMVRPPGCGRHTQHPSTASQ